GYLLASGHPLANAMADAHASAHGGPPERTVTGGTTDARYYLNRFGVPALAYGPAARNIHATDEAVELACLGRGAQPLAGFIPGFFAAGGRRGEPLGQEARRCPPPVSPSARCWRRSRCGPRGSASPSASSQPSRSASSSPASGCPPSGTWR